MVGDPSIRQLSWRWFATVLVSKCRCMPNWWTVINTFVHHVLAIIWIRRLIGCIEIMDGRVLEHFTGLCFRWAHQKSSFTDILQECYKSEKYVDMHVCCEGYRVPCHRSVLCSVSPFLKSLLQEVASDTVMVTGIRFSILQKVIQFIYTGTLVVENDVMLEFIDAVKYLGITIFDEEDVIKSLLEVGPENDGSKDTNIDLKRQSKVSLKHSDKRGFKSALKCSNTQAFDQSLKLDVESQKGSPSKTTAQETQQPKIGTPSAGASEEKSTIDKKEEPGLIVPSYLKDEAKGIAGIDLGNQSSASLKHSEKQKFKPAFKVSKAQSFEKSLDLPVSSEEHFPEKSTVSQSQHAKIDCPSPSGSKEKSTLDIKEEPSLITPYSNKEGEKEAAKRAECPDEDHANQPSCKEITEKCACPKGYTDSISIGVHMLIHSYLDGCRSNAEPGAKDIKVKEKLGKYSKKLKRVRATKDPPGTDLELSPKPGKITCKHPGGTSVSKYPKPSSEELDSLPPILRPNNDMGDSQKSSADSEPGPETPPHLERMSSPHEVDSAPRKNTSSAKEHRFVSKEDLPYTYDEYGRILRKQMKDQGILKEVNVALKDSVYEMFCILKD